MTIGANDNEIECYVCLWNIIEKQKQQKNL